MTNTIPSTATERTTAMDTPQQKAALRANKTARWVRANFPAGTRVEGAPGVFGTVARHVPARTSLGGVLVVEWDSGVTGRVTVTTIRKVES